VFFFFVFVLWVVIVVAGGDCVCGGGGGGGGFGVGFENHGVGQAYFFFRETGWAKGEFHDDWGWVIVCFVKNHTHYNSCGRSEKILMLQCWT